MKKALAVLAALLILFSAASAETDVKKMTDDEIYAMINLLKTELLTRIARVEEKTFIIDNDEITIYCTGNGSVNFMNQFQLEVVFINNSDKEIGVQFDHVVINGWEVDCYSQLSSVKPGRKTKANISLDYEAADLSSYKEIEEIALSFYTFDGSTYRTITNYDEVLLNFNGSSWS